jgi:hypothetical protein
VHDPAREAVRHPFPLLRRHAHRELPRAAGSWIGVVSDRLGRSGHEGNIHSGHVMDNLLSLSELIVGVIDAEDQ